MGSHGTIVSTGDFGRTWSPRRPPPAPRRPPFSLLSLDEVFLRAEFHLSAVVFAAPGIATTTGAAATSATIGWASGSVRYHSGLRAVAVGVVLFTRDGGITWTVQEHPAPAGEPGYEEGNVQLWRSGVRALDLVIVPA